ncbi:MAG: hypothetical protein M3328_18435, partial [Chloroflexota bacterium]|nr:hypothetical protein [Chloroflexota bacterium]
MSSRNDRLRVQARANTPERVRVQRANVPSRPATGAATARPVAFSTLPLDAHRAIASMALVLMLVVSLGAPLSAATANPAPLLALQIDGSNSVAPGFTGAGLGNAIFPYVGVIERSRGNVSSVWPEVAEVLNSDPESVFVRRAIVGQIYAETTGSLEKKIKETGLEVNPDPSKLEFVETSYLEMTGGDAKPGRGVNGLAAVLLIRSLNTTGERQKELERQAVFGFRQAVNEAPQDWQLTYNWALANFLGGNYATAYEAMRSIRRPADEANNKLVPFWIGIAALRSGDPALAIPTLKEATEATAPSGSNDALQQLYFEARDLSREALGDAQWAYRRPLEAYDTYYNSLLLANSSPGLYTKWLRLGLEQRG